MDALHPEAIQRVLQPTKGIRDVRLTSSYGGEENKLQHLPDAGEASLHSRKVGDVLIVDRSCFLGQPKEARAPNMLEVVQVALSILENIPTTDFPCHARGGTTLLATNLPAAALHAHRCTSPNVGEELATSPATATTTSLYRLLVSLTYFTCI